MEYNLSEIMEHCDPFVQFLKRMNKKTFFVRGSHKKNDNIILKGKHITSRKPLDIPEYIHDSLNSIYRLKFGWDVRGGIFCFAVFNIEDEIQDLSYGKSYIFLPVGEFRYCYASEIFDLYQHYLLFKKKDLENSDDKFINSIDYQNDNLDKIVFDDSYSNRSFEVMFDCEKYYLLDLSFLDELKGLIWNY